MTNLSLIDAVPAVSRRRRVMFRARIAQIRIEHIVLKDKLLETVEESIKLLRKQWYEEVTEGEIAAIKAAMVSGPREIATHSGHWYNCANGHPVSPLTHYIPLPWLFGANLVIVCNW